jgi:hypothetical protein
MQPTAHPAIFCTVLKQRSVKSSVAWRWPLCDRGRAPGGRRVAEARYGSGWSIRPIGEGEHHPEHQAGGVA